MAILQSKALLRKEMNAIVNAITDAEVMRQSAIVSKKVIEHPKYKAAKFVSLYLSFDKEVNTGSILEDIFKSGKTCFIPRFRKGIPDMEMIKLESLEDYNNLPMNRWNIKQPHDDEQRTSVFDMESFDLVIAPGLAFTTTNSRLGRGKGYYDKFLHKCSQQFKKPPFIIALAFNEQIIESIPLTDTDVLMDEVLYADQVKQTFHP